MPNESLTTMNNGNYWTLRRKEETRKLEIACGKAKAHRLIREMEGRSGEWNDKIWADQLMGARNKALMEATNEPT